MMALSDLYLYSSWGDIQTSAIQWIHSNMWQGCPYIPNRALATNNVDIIVRWHVWAATVLRSVNKTKPGQAVPSLRGGGGGQANEMERPMEIWQVR